MSSRDTPMPEQSIEKLEDVRPGDLLFTTMSGAPAQVVVYGGQLMLGEFVAVGEFIVGHVAVVVEASRQLPPGTVRHRSSGRYFTPRDQTGLPWRDLPFGDYDTYESGVITAPKIVEAMPSGARLRELRLDRDWTPKTAYARLVEDWPGQAEDAAAIARLMIGIPYGFSSYAALAAWRFGARPARLEAWIDRRQPKAVTLPHWSSGPELGSAITRGGRLPMRVICSQLGDQAWTLAGKQVMPHGTKPQIVTPGGLASRLLMRRGVVWGGAGLG